MCVVALDTGDIAEQRQRGKKHSPTGLRRRLGRPMAAQAMEGKQEYFVGFSAVTGKHMWVVQRHWPSEDPVVDDATGLAYLFFSGGVDAVDQRTGVVKWSDKRMESGLPTPSGLLIGPSYDALYALNASSGHEVWKYTGGPWSAQMGAGSTGPGLATDGTLIATGTTPSDYDQNPNFPTVSRLSPSTGQKDKWEELLPLTNWNSWMSLGLGLPGCANSTVVVSGPQVGYMGLDLATGARVWDKYPTSNFACFGLGDSSPQPWVDRHSDTVWGTCYSGLYAGESWDNAIGFDAATGAVRYNVTIQKSSDSTGPYWVRGASSGGQDRVFIIDGGRGVVLAYDV